MVTGRQRVALEDRKITPEEQHAMKVLVPRALSGQRMAIRRAI